MPKRTNDFQKLILLLHQQLGPEGATVTESNLIRDEDTGDLREVDITVEYGEGDRHITVLIECRNHRRAQTVHWVEELIGKYVNRQGRAIVAVSASGFSRSAKRKAMKHGILPLSIEDATDTSWLGDVKSFPTLKVGIAMPVLEGVDTKLVDKSLLTEDFPETRVTDVVFWTASGVRMGTALELFDRLQDADALLNIDKLPVRPKDGLVELGIRLQPGSYFRTQGGIILQVEGIVFLVRPNHEELDLSVKAGTYDNRAVATAVGRTHSWRVQFVIVKGKDGKPKLALSLQAASGPLPQGVMKVYGVA